MTNLATVKSSDTSKDDKFSYCQLMSNLMKYPMEFSNGSSPPKSRNAAHFNEHND